MPEDEAEMRKTLLAVALDAKPVLFLDNVTEHLNSRALEAFMTATTYQGRILGSNRIAEYPYNTTVIITGNNATFSPSLRRRSMMVELFLPEAKFEDHKFNGRLELEDIQKRRAQLLAAKWALIRQWIDDGCPQVPTDYGQFNSACSWYNQIAPILAYAGYGPFAAHPVNARSSGDLETKDMEELVKQMVEEPDFYTFDQLADLAEQHDLFNGFLGHNIVRGPSANAKLGAIFRRFDDRRFSWVDPIKQQRETWRFVIEQKNKTRATKEFYKRAT